jgi:8-oxo-dGTP pyrophosphatase MutT (NUDIX family)
MNEDLFHLGAKAIIQYQGKVLLLQKNKKGTLFWELPGGRIQKGETVEQALLREVEEETGLTGLSDIEYINTLLTDLRIALKEHDVGLLLAIYSCSHLNPQIQLSQEHVDYSWFEPSEAMRHLGVTYSPAFVKMKKI